MSIFGQFKKSSKSDPNSRDRNARKSSIPNTTPITVIVNLKAPLPTGVTFYHLEYASAQHFSDQTSGVDTDTDWLWLEDRYGNVIGIAPGDARTIEIPNGNNNVYRGYGKS